MMDKMIKPFRYYPDPPAIQDAWGLSLYGIGGYSGSKGEIDRSGRFFPRFALVYILNGAGYCLAKDGKTREVLPGDCLLVIPGLWHAYFPHEKTGWSQYWVLFDGYYARALLEQGVFKQEESHFSVGMDYAVIEQYESMKLMVETNRIPPFRQLAAGLYRLINLVWQLKDGPRGPAFGHEMQKAEALIREKWNDELDYKKIAADLHMSYSHFRRRFKQATGYSPHNFQLSLRINKAKHLLDSSSFSIKQLADRTGFKDPYYFSRIFKEKTGVAPSKWHRF